MGGTGQNPVKLELGPLSRLSLPPGVQKAKCLSSFKPLLKSHLLNKDQPTSAINTATQGSLSNTTTDVRRFSFTQQFLF